MRYRASGALFFVADKMCETGAGKSSTITAELCLLLRLQYYFFSFSPVQFMHPSVVIALTKIDFYTHFPPLCCEKKHSCHSRCRNAWKCPTILWAMSGVFPIYKTYFECSNECGSFVSHCLGTAPLIVCQLNVFVFLSCIFLAVFTGVVIPTLCLLCYVTNWCAEARGIWLAGRSIDEEMVKLNPRSVLVSASESGTPVVSVQPVPPHRKPVKFKVTKSAV